MNQDQTTYECPLAVVKGRHILLIVTGGIAAYKAAELVRLLTQAGACVRVAMTHAATRFITPLTFESLTSQPVAVDIWERSQTEIEHISWAQWAEVIVIAPASADFIARLTAGMANDLAASIVLASEQPKLIAPAMNTGMYVNPATQDNLSVLQKRGFTIMESPEGPLACGQIGPGRLPEPELIALFTARLLAPKILKDRRVLITAGATHEPWDAIRYLSNRSSGRMGLALAQAAWLLGGQVTVIAGPQVKVPITTTDFIFRKIETTEDLLVAVKENLKYTDTLIMAAAPADFCPTHTVKGKLKKDQEVHLELRLNPDILKTISPIKENRLYVGFAAEDNDLITRALKKLSDKGLDFIVANQAGGPQSAFDSQNNHLWLIDKKGQITEIGPTSKFAAAWALWPLICKT